MQKRGMWCMIRAKQFGGTFDCEVDGGYRSSARSSRDFFVSWRWGNRCDGACAPLPRDFNGPDRWFGYCTRSSLDARCGPWSRSHRFARRSYALVAAGGVISRDICRQLDRRTHSGRGTALRSCYGAHHCRCQARARYSNPSGAGVFRGPHIRFSLRGPQAAIGSTHCRLPQLSRMRRASLCSGHRRGRGAGMMDAPARAPGS